MVNRIILSFVFVLSFLAFAAAPRAWADILVVQNQGNTPLPVETGSGTSGRSWVPINEADISMESETVQLEEGDYGFKASCTFQMKSHADKTLTRQVAFPIAHPRYFDYMSREFKVVVDGNPVATKMVRAVQEKPGEEREDWETRAKKLDYVGYVIWPVSWQAGETKTIVCKYDAGETGHLWGLVTGWSLDYVVRTGGLWKGNIGAADIRFKFQSDPRLGGRGMGSLENGQKTLFRMSYPEQAKWASKTEIRWQFTDWNPKEDIFVQRMAWMGLGEKYGFVLPASYSGNKKLYTDAWLDELIQQEIEPWEAFFPRETGALNKPRLKSRIADCLLHEIYARHGDHFIVGKLGSRDIATLPTGVSYNASTGLLYGEWYGYFIPYMLHGGWYQPDDAKSTKTVLKELNATERQNVQFLQRYIRKS